jgi:hypothetical protein
MWSGGTYTKSNAGTGGWTGDAVAGIAIDATRHDTQDNDFAAGINQCLTKDGQNSCTADLNFGGFRPSNVAGGSAAAPAYTANNDTDTGAFSPAANAYAIATGGVERVRVDSSGFVGIGRTVPLVSLDVQGIARIGNSASSDFRIEMGSTGVGTTRSAYIDGAANNVIVANQQNGFMAFHTNNTERLRINAIGEINVSTPSAIVNVGSAATSTETCAVQIGQSRTGSGSSLLDLIGDTTYPDFGLRVIRAAGPSGGSEIHHRGTGNLNIRAQEVAPITFLTQNFERMQITSGGTVQFRGSGNSSTFNTALCAAQIAYVGTGTEFGIGMRPATDVTTAILFQNAAGTSIGSISTTAAATAFNTTSDYRLKNNVQPFPDGLNKVKALSPSQWEWSADNSEGFGFIAHELQAVIPEAVTGAKDAVDANGDPIYQAVDYGKLTTVLVAAVKELTAKVEALEAELAILKGA